MFSRSDSGNKQNSSAQTGESNKAVLLLFCALLLVIFMDKQARRHYKNVVGIELPRGTAFDSPVEKIKQGLKKENISIFPAIKKSASEIFGSGKKEAVYNPGIEGEALQARKKTELFLTANKGHIYLYFIRFKKRRSEIVRVRRKTRSERVKVATVIEMLKTGPIPGERGLLTAFGSEINVLGIKIIDRVALINLSKEISRNNSRIVRDRLSQLSLTLKQFPEIKSLKVFINGQHFKKFDNQLERKVRDIDSISKLMQ